MSKFRPLALLLMVTITSAAAWDESDALGVPQVCTFTRQLLERSSSIESAFLRSTALNRIKFEAGYLTTDHNTDHPIIFGYSYFDIDNDRVDELIMIREWTIGGADYDILYVANNNLFDRSNEAHISSLGDLLTIDRGPGGSYWKFGINVPYIRLLQYNSVNYVLLGERYRSIDPTTGIVLTKQFVIVARVAENSSVGKSLVSDNPVTLQLDMVCKYVQDSP